jgi:hypothetical protein
MRRWGWGGAADLAICNASSGWKFSGDHGRPWKPFKAVLFYIYKMEN